LLIPVEDTIAERVEHLAPLPLAFDPGEQWAYGMSTDVLGRLVEVVSGHSLETFFQERIFRPLKMQDTHFYLPKEKLSLLAPLYTPNEDKSDLLPVGSEILEAGPIKFSADFCYEEKGNLFAGGSGLVSSTQDYFTFLQMLLDGGGSILKASTVAQMTKNQIGDLTILFPCHGDGFGYGFGVLTERGEAEDVASVGTYSWGGIFNTYYWVDPQKDMIGILMTQVFPNDHLNIRNEFKRLAYEALDTVVAPKVPAGFKASIVVKDINAATALTIAPDGRIFYAEQTGVIRVVNKGKLLPKSAIDLSAKLDTWWQRGLIGLTLHPDFPRTPYLFAVYVAKEPYTHHVVSRFTVVGDTLDAASEMILIKGDDQSKLGGFQPAGHQGGPICFGQDGMLYIGLGEQTASEPSQSLKTLQGKILRIRQDGSIPKDNPFYTKADGKYRSIYAIGIRNPFGLAVEPSSGRLLESDVGGSAFEEINDIVAGANYGWPKAEGMSDNKDYTNPLHAYPPAIGRSICGAMFYPEEGNFPHQWHGKFFVADWANH
jgi:glucose/arabinose dehydrogenase